MGDTIRRKLEVPFFQAEKAVFDRRDLTSEEKLTYLYLSRRADSELKSFPSYNTIARDCGFSRSTAIRVVSRLIEKCLLEKQVRKSDKGDHTSNEYLLLTVEEVDREIPNSRSWLVRLLAIPN